MGLILLTLAAATLALAGCEQPTPGPQTTAVDNETRVDQLTPDDTADGEMTLTPTHDVPTTDYGTGEPAGADWEADTAEVSYPPSDAEDTTVDTGTETDATDDSIGADFVIHTVRKKDTLWSIAEQYYGTGKRWREILQANPKLDPDPRKLPAGVKIRIPLDEGGK